MMSILLHGYAGRDAMQQTLRGIMTLSVNNSAAVNSIAATVSFVISHTTTPNATMRCPIHKTNGVMSLLIWATQLTGNAVAM